MDLTTTSECLLAVCFDLSLWKHRDNKNKNISTKKYEQLPCRSEFVWTVYKFNSTGFLFKTRITRHHLELALHQIPGGGSLAASDTAHCYLCKNCNNHSQIAAKCIQSDFHKAGSRYLAAVSCCPWGSDRLETQTESWEWFMTPDVWPKDIYSVIFLNAFHIHWALPFNFVLNRPDRGCCITLLTGDLYILSCACMLTAFDICAADLTWFDKFCLFNIIATFLLCSLFLCRLM